MQAPMSSEVLQGHRPGENAGHFEGHAGPCAEQHCNPRRRAEAAFARIAATRMAGAPTCNAALQVELVDVLRWQDEWLGVLITPWAINLLLLPGGGRNFRALWPGDTQWWQFPSGAYEFLGNRERELGAYQVRALFSPALEFATQDAAREAARAALMALFSSAQSPLSHGVGSTEQEGNAA